MLGCEIWTIKNVECRRIDAFELWCWRRFLRMPWTARGSNQSILKEINPVFTRRTDPVKILLQEPSWPFPKAFRCCTSNIITAAAVAASLQSCLTLYVPIDSSLPGSSVPAILQARTLEWVAISFSNAGKWKVKVKSLVVSNSSRPHGLQPTRPFCPWEFPGKHPHYNHDQEFVKQIQLHWIKI